MPRKTVSTTDRQNISLAPPRSPFSRFCRAGQREKRVKRGKFCTGQPVLQRAATYECETSEDAPTGHGDIGDTALAASDLRARARHCTGRRGRDCAVV